jgi:hypothetical protein
MNQISGQWKNKSVVMDVSGRIGLHLIKSLISGELQWTRALRSWEVLGALQ